MRRAVTVRTRAPAFGPLTTVGRGVEGATRAQSITKSRARDTIDKASSRARPRRPRDLAAGPQHPTPHVHHGHGAGSTVRGPAGALARKYEAARPGDTADGGERPRRCHVERVSPWGVSPHRTRVGRGATSRRVRATAPPTRRAACALCDRSPLQERARLGRSTRGMAGRAWNDRPGNPTAAVRTRHDGYAGCAPCVRSRATDLAIESMRPFRGSSEQCHPPPTHGSGASDELTVRPRASDENCANDAARGPRRTSLPFLSCQLAGLADAVG
jgi:hypothetical protein